MITSIVLDGIGHVLADNELKVPVYQRAFSWGNEEVSELLNDLWESFRRNEAEYFLGTIVHTGQKSEGPSVVDGQQRLATVSMVLAAVRDVLDRKKDKRAQPFANRYLFSLNLKTEEIEPKLRLNEVDDDYFRKHVLSNPTEQARNTEPKVDSHRRIRAAFRLGKDAVSRFASTSPKDDVGLLIDWSQFIETKAKVIVVSVPDESNAFLIFETLNDRGLELSIADLLKNYILGKSDNRLNEVRANWLTATAALEGSGGDKLTATFIRHFWSSREGLVRERELYKDLKKHIQTKQAAVDFAVDLAENAKLYAAILNSDHDFWSALGSEARQYVQTLIILRLEQYRPLLLACLSHIRKPKELTKILRLLVSWNVRLLIVGGLGSGTLEKHYGGAAKKVRRGELKTASDLARYAADFIPSDTEFESKFATATVSQAFLARYYLQALERTLSGEANPELVPNTLETDVNLEHVLPQHPKAGEWPQFDEEGIRANCKRVGNLTLLRVSDNAKGGNRPFNVKRAAYVGSRLQLNKSISQLAVWNQSAIDDRQSLLAKQAVRTWPLKP